MSANEVSEVSKLKHIIEDLERQLTSLRFDYKRAVEDAAHLKDRKFVAANAHRTHGAPRMIKSSANRKKHRQKQQLTEEDRVNLYNQIKYIQDNGSERQIASMEKTLRQYGVTVNDEKKTVEGTDTNVLTIWTSIKNKVNYIKASTQAEAPAPSKTIMKF